MCKRTCHHKHSDMSEEQGIQEELKGASPFLSRLKAEDKGDGFTVPPVYFRELQENVIRRTARQPAAPGRWARWQQALDHLLPRMHPVAVLAGLALIVAGVGWMTLRSTTPSSQQMLADASQEELQVYIEDHTHAFTTDLILEVAEDEAEIDLLLPVDEFSEEEADRLLKDLLEEMDENTLQEIL